MRTARDHWSRNVQLLTFSVTDKCPARCAHCLAGSGPSETAMLAADEMIRIYHEAKEYGGADVVVFTGGEPTLLGDALLDVIATVSLAGALTRIVTNAWWAEDEASAKATIRQLREAGLDEINFSMDDYHAVWVPVENVARAYRAARGVGFSAVVLALANSVNSRITPDWIHQNIDPDIPVVAQELSVRSAGPSPEADGTVYEISSHGYSRVGRARHLKDRLVETDPLLSRVQYSCQEVMNTVVVDAHGNVGACCGLRTQGNPILTLGNARSSEFGQLMDAGFGDVIIQALHALGPKYLLDLARRVDETVEIRPGYSHVCEICEDLTLNPAAVAALKLMEPTIVAEVQARRREGTSGTAFPVWNG